MSDAIEYPPMQEPEASTSNICRIEQAENVQIIEHQVNHFHSEPLGTSFLSADTPDCRKVSFLSEKSPTISDNTERSITSDFEDDIGEIYFPENCNLHQDLENKTLIKKPNFSKKFFILGLTKQKKKQNSYQDRKRDYYDLYVEQRNEADKANHDLEYYKTEFQKLTEKYKDVCTKCERLQLTNARLLSENIFTQDGSQQKIHHREQTLKGSETMTKEVRERVIQSLPGDFIRMFTFEKIQLAVDRMKCMMIKKGQRIFAQGNISNTFYVIETGSYVFKKDQKSICAGLKTFMPKQNAGKWDVLGADEFFYNTTHFQTCVCQEPGKVWCLTRSEFQKVIGNIAPIRHLAIYDCLSQVFPSFSQKQREHLTRRCEVLLLSAGDFLIRLGDTARHIYVVKKGQLITLNNGSSRGKVLSVGDVISQPCDLIRFTHSYVAYGMETVQCIAIPVTKFSGAQLKKINSSDQDATRENVLRNFEAHLNVDENPDEDKSGTSGYVSQSSISTHSTGM